MCADKWIAWTSLEKNDEIKCMILDFFFCKAKIKCYAFLDLHTHIYRRFFSDIYTQLNKRILKVKDSISYQFLLKRYLSQINQGLFYRN